MPYRIEEKKRGERVPSVRAQVCLCDSLSLALFVSSERPENQRGEAESSRAATVEYVINQQSRGRGKLARRRRNKKAGKANSS